MDRQSTPARRRIAAAFITPEMLEPRTLMSVDFRSIDGSGNNQNEDDWGSAGIPLLRVAPAAYADGKSRPAGGNRPSARLISNTVAAALSDGEINDRNMSAFVYVWGQFIDHDMDLTTNGTPVEPFNVPVPTGDSSFDIGNTGTQVIRLNRSTYDPATGMSEANPREQTNTLSAWIDGSVVYGNDPVRAAALRTGFGGKLKTSAGNLMPFNTAGLANANDAHLVADDKLFLGGDVRANENIELTAVQTLFVREHNRVATQIARLSRRRMGDEQIYQLARRYVVAEIQSITYNEFLPALLGRDAVDRYRGYDPTVNPGIANEFSTAAFRLGHSLLGDDVEFLDNDGEEVRDELALKDAFFNPTVVQETGLDPILKYLASDRAQELDSRIVDGVRNFLFGPPGAGGFDLASLNIQRGRDHGLADYNTVRAAYGLPRVDGFDDITSDPALAAKLQLLYGTVDNVDLWVGGLAEDHVRGGSVGRTFTTIVADQFERLRDGDRFWYQKDFAGTYDLGVLQRTKLSDVIRRNTGAWNLQENVFIFDVTLNGTLYSDANRNGRRDRGEIGLPGWTVELLDDAGEKVATTTSRLDGNYSFKGIDLGNFTVDAVEPLGWKAVGNIGVISVTRGATISGLNIGYAKKLASTASALDGGGGATLVPAAPSIDSTDLSRDDDAIDDTAAIVDLLRE